MKIPYLPLFPLFPFSFFFPFVFPLPQWSHFNVSFPSPLFETSSTLWTPRVLRTWVSLTPDMYFGVV
jgi:hypothetical protein